MFKRSVVILGRYTQDSLRSSRCIHPNFLIRSHHLTNIKELIPGNKGIYQGQFSQRDGHLNEASKKLEDGSIAVVHAQEHESVDYANSMGRRFLHDLDLQQAQRSGRNRWLQEENKGNPDDLGRLTKQITMAEDDGDKKGECQEKDPCKTDEPSKKKKKSEGMSEKCKALAEKDKCRKLAERKKLRKMLKKCREMAQREKCKEMAEIEKCKKKQEKENNETED